MDIHMGIPTGENHIPILNQMPWVRGSSPYGSPYPWNLVVSMDIPIWNMIFSRGDPHRGKSYSHPIPIPTATLEY